MLIIAHKLQQHGCPTLDAMVMLPWITTALITQNHTMDTCTRKTLLTGPSNNGLYSICVPSIRPLHKVAFSAVRASTDTWHRRLGDPHPDLLKSMLPIFSLPFFPFAQKSIPVPTPPPNDHSPYVSFFPSHQPDLPDSPTEPATNISNPPPQPAQPQSTNVPNTPPQPAQPQPDQQLPQTQPTHTTTSHDTPPPPPPPPPRTRPANLRQNPPKPNRYNPSAYHTTTESNNLEPTTFTVANKSPEWQHAMSEEYKALMKKWHVDSCSSGLEC
ncbi:extensin-like [Helianthus annuus]|uniref:extensin-like n=1 Tax=Helianthus annuus TaxID=4232 RepID=UPI001652BA87|nr:extensin-like [Helianthus annuus]